MAALLPLLVAAAGLIVMLSQRKQLSIRAPLLLLWLPSLINISALYWGMIYRLRYSVILLPAVAIFGSIVLTSTVAKKRTFLFLVLVAMVMPWLSWYFLKTDPGGRLVAGPGALLLPAAGLILYMIARVRQQHAWVLPAFLVLSMHVPLLKREVRPMMVETMEHEFIEPERREVMRYILRNYDHSRILIDMGKQAPLVYDLGLNVKEFVYNEGGETVWHEALKNPAKHVGWMCSEQGDAIWERLQVDPDWVRAYVLALKTEHFSIYRLKTNSRLEVSD
jgi:hypothetical protein